MVSHVSLQDPDQILLELGKKISLKLLWNAGLNKFKLLLSCDPDTNPAFSNNTYYMTPGSGKLLNGRMEAGLFGLHLTTDTVRFSF